MNEPTNATFADAKNAVIGLLRSRGKKARFTTEVFALLERSSFVREEIEQALAQLESDGIVMIRDNFCADPHLSGVDLRVVALVETIDGADPQLSAIRLIDDAWNKWLGEYLSNHRCG